MRQDRTYHEMQTLADALFVAGTWGQYNLRACLCCERLARRMQAIVEAHRDPEQVSWGMARYFGGSASAVDAAMPNMRSYVARRAREDAEVSTAYPRSGAAAAAPHPTARAANMAVDDGVLPLADGGGVSPQRGRGRGGRRGRGLPPAHG